MIIGSAGNISPSKVMVGLSVRPCRGACTGPAIASPRAYLNMAPANTSLASAWVGTPKPGTSIPDDSHPVDVFGQDLQGNTARRRDAEVDDHNRVVERWISLLVHRLADVLEQFARHQ